MGWLFPSRRLCAGILFVHVSAWLMVLTTAAPSGETATREEMVRFAGSGDVPIAGTLTLPAAASAAQPVPAVLLIQGSGPTDRDGNQPPMLQSNVLRELAETFAAAGIASLRFDKRGMYANGATLPQDHGQWPAFFTWQAMVGDARAALALLATHPAIAKERIGVFGHSEGGLIALDLATHDQRPPKVLILAATPGRRLGDVIHDQLSQLLTRQGATTEQRQFFLDADTRIRAAIVAGGTVPPDVPAGLAPLYPDYLGPFLQAELLLDPILMVKNFHEPILVINGGADEQVFAERDGALFTAALAGRKDGTQVLIPPGVSHNLKKVGDGGTGIAGPIDPETREAIVGWARKNL
jgi:dipeptidyl aminopeptidase/acylaminoacyl peptidase